MAVEPFDDRTIEDDHGLVRFVPNDQIVYDATIDEFRPSSAAFSMSSDDGCMSVDLEHELQKAGQSPTQNLASRSAGSGAVRLVAGCVRNQELVAFHDPLEGNKFHGQIANLKEHGKISGGTRKRLARAATWLHNPKSS